MAYEAQSYPLQPPSAFIPPKDYPTVDVVTGRRPKDPPVDYAIFNGYMAAADPYPFREAPRYGPVREQQNDYEENNYSPPPPVSSKGNKAFMLHMRNHNKFNTVEGGYPSCDNCPICKAMNVADAELTKEEPIVRQPPRRSYQQPVEEEDEEDQQYGEVQYVPQPKPIHKRPQRRSVQEYYQQQQYVVDDQRDADYRKERRQFNYLKDLRSKNAVVAYVLADRVARKPQELTVFKGEYLEVIEDSHRWWECCNVSGQSGYVPHTILDIISYVK